MSNTKPSTPKTAPRREVTLAKPIVNAGKRYEPGGEDKPRLTERQIERLSASGHIAPGNAAGAKSAAKANTQEG